MIMYVAVKMQVHKVEMIDELSHFATAVLK